jgi:RNA polymerase sigma factor (sigma-70 family)
VLARRLRERDSTAWEELYRAYEGRLYGFAYRLSGNAHDAADLVQETFVRALPRLDRLDPDRLDISAYLFATLKNIFLKNVERERRQEPVEEVPEPAETGPIEDQPERSALLRRQQEEVRLANARLSPRQRLVLALRELEDRSYAEIGEIVGLNENAVAQLISRARDSLRTELRLVQVDPEKLPRECRSFLPQLSAYLDGQLRGTKRERTLAHLESCGRCQAALADMREAQRRYRALVPPALGVVALRERVDDALAASGYWDKPAGWALLGGARPRTFLLVGLAGMAAVGVLVAVLATRDGSPNESAVAEPPAIVAASTEGVVSTVVEPQAAVSLPAVSVGDSSGPTTLITASPPVLSETDEVVFRFEATEPNATFECRLDVRAVACSSPARYTDLAPGEYTFAVRATDPQGNTGPWETRRFAVAEPPGTTTGATTGEDEAAPTVTITGGPPRTTEATSASFSFRAGGPGASFACSLDGGGFSNCSSPKRYSGLAPGSHTFAVRARDADGNTGPAASYVWRVAEPEPATTAPPPSPPPPADTSPPTTTLTEVPSGQTASTTATFAFTASEEGSTFACSLDGGGFEPCSSPRTLDGLAPGEHSFRVHATDTAGNVGPDTAYVWTIVAAQPDLVVSNLGATSVTVANVGGAPAGGSVVFVAGVGSFTVPSLGPGASSTFTWSTCAEGTITATADRSRLVAESNESNNSASVQNLC